MAAEETTGEDPVDEDVLYWNEPEGAIPLVVRRNEHNSSVVLESMMRDGEVCNRVPVFQDELLPVARALIEAYEEGLR